MHAAVNGFCPEFISKVLIPVFVRPGCAALRSSTSCAFEVLHTRTEFGKIAFLVAGPAAWNSLPPSFRQITDTEQFKHALQAHLYSVAYNNYCNFVFTC